MPDRVKDPDSEIVVRRATEADTPVLGRLGATLMIDHYRFDPLRFMAPRGDPSEGYAAFLKDQLDDPDAVIFVAEHGGRVVGYVYAGLEPISWKELRDAAGFVHDVVVDGAARQKGVATALVEAAADWLRSRGAPRVVLWTAEPNVPAQRLFSRLGFRRTMIEMTREL